MPPITTGPAIRGVCRVLNQNSCGSGSICGNQPNGNALILTNAHVAGSRVGRTVRVQVESTGDEINARVIMAAYSDRTIADWAVLETIEPYTKVKPVYVSKKRPTGSHYTKGFPRCRAHNGTDITTVRFGNGQQSPVWFWEPDAIGGQSGSGVWSDLDNFQYGLLTWQWGGHGAGQITAEIYRQARGRTTAGFAKPPGLVEVENDYDFTGLDRTDLDDPIVEEGFFAEASISELPIWAEDQVDPDPDPNPNPNPDPGTPRLTISDFIEYNRELAEFHERWQNKFDRTPDTNGGDTTVPVNPANPTFGL
jgi:hypothetical protein